MPLKSCGAKTQRRVLTDGFIYDKNKDIA